MEEEYSRGSDCVMSRSLVTEAGTVGRTSVRVEAVTQSLVSVSCFGTFITLFNTKRLAVKSIDLGIGISMNNDINNNQVQLTENGLTGPGPADVPPGTTPAT